MVSEARYPRDSADGRNEWSHVQCEINSTAQEGLRGWLGPARMQLKAEFPWAGGQASGGARMHLRGG